MPLTDVDLLQPKGELAPSFFPTDGSGSLTTRLETYIARGYELVPGNDEAARAYAYAQAYGAVYQRLITAPASASAEGEGSQAYSGEQIKSVRAERDKWQARFDALEASAGAGVTQTERTGTRAVRTHFGW